MTSKASSIQPRPAAIRVRRCPREMVESEKLAAPAMEGDCTRGRGRPRHILLGSVVQELEVAAGGAHVSGNLGAKLFHGGKFDLRAQAAQEKQFNFRFRGEFQGMEVEQVSFDGERLCAEGGTVADVGHGIKALFRHAGAGNVNAIAVHELFITAEIDGGNRVFGAVTAAAARIGNDAEGSAEEVSGVADIAFGGD